jgi:hypothetical protein
MFLNFWAHEALIPYLGVDVSHTFPGEPRNVTANCEPFACKHTGLFSAVLLLVAWVRWAMGLTPSPYYAAQCTTRAKRICLGDPRDPTNVYRWSKLQLKQPDQVDYQAHLPWAYKVREDGKIAADNHGYIDDNCQTAPTKEECWQAGSRWTKQCSYLGTHDAPQKRREPSQEAGPWAGTVAHTANGRVTKLVTQER